MAFNWKRLLARGPEKIESDRLRIKELPFEEIGITAVYILIAGLWCVFSDDVFDCLLGMPLDSPALETLKGINFVTTDRPAAVSGLAAQRAQPPAGAGGHAPEPGAVRVRRPGDDGGHLGLEPGDQYDLVERWDSEAVRLSARRTFPQNSSGGWNGCTRRTKTGSCGPSGARRTAAAGPGRVITGSGARTAVMPSVLDHGYILRNSDGKPARVVGGIRDITERRKAEEALKNSRRQLRALVCPAAVCARRGARERGAGDSRRTGTDADRPQAQPGLAGTEDRRARARPLA